MPTRNFEPCCYIAYLGRSAARGQALDSRIKHDGYRCQVLIERGQVRGANPYGHDWTDRYASIVAAAANLNCQSAIIDGEAIVQDGDGISDFESLSFAMRWRPDAIILYAFDLMHLNGDIHRRPLLERRSLLKALVRNDDKSRIQFSEEFVGDAAALFAACAEKKLEGIVSKLRYVSLCERSVKDVAPRTLHCYRGHRAASRSSWPLQAGVIEGSNRRLNHLFGLSERSAFSRVVMPLDSGIVN